MKTITTTAIVALMTASVVLTAVAPTYAQTSTAPTATTEAQAKPGASFRGNHGPRGGGDLFNFARGVEAVEIALVRLSHAVEMTPEQQALFDTLKTDALAAATSFTATTEALRPAAPAAGETAALPDMSARLETAITFQSAQLAALEAVQPAATAFFDSLTDEQKTQLMPQRPERTGDRGERGGERGGFDKGGDRQHGGQHFGGPRPAPTDAPAAAPAAPATNG